MTDFDSLTDRPVDLPAQLRALSAGTERPTGPRRRDWQTSYTARLRITDTLVVIGSVLLAHWVRFGDTPAEAQSASISSLDYSVISVAIAALWLCMLVIFAARSPRIIGNGPEEYRRITTSSLWLFGLISIFALLYRVEFARGYLALALPVGVLGLLVSRWLWRQVIARGRKRGEFQTSVLVVGSEHAVLNLTRSFERGNSEGYRVVGVCMPGYGGERGEQMTVDGRSIPIFGDEHAVIEAHHFSGADTVAVTATEQLGHEGIRKLVWDLEPHGVDLVVAPGVVDVSGPRLSMRPVAGLPLIHVEKPAYHGAKRFGKSAFDVSFAVCALTAILPVLLAVAIAIKVTSKGPVFYSSERMGLDGKPFAMLKFRSMVQGADRAVAALADRDEGAGVLFKIRDDPRVTAVGRIIRKYSIDELPQFFNVLRREMSVVGPRPPLRCEVEGYDGEVRRRLLVKPGLTGLWQVSGRSDLSWDETVRLDLSYVENWSMVGDLLIIAKTVKAVLRADGAY